VARETGYAGGMPHYTLPMQSSTPAGEVITALAARFGAGGDVAPQGTGGFGGWVLALASALVLLVVGSFAARLARHVASRSVPELIVLLDQSAAFYSRWPEDRLASAPRGELMAEAARCGRTIELLESRGATVTGWGPAARGPVNGLKAWIALLQKQIGERVNTPPGLSHA
jgi:hypothetical protein